MGTSARAAAGNLLLYGPVDAPRELDDKDRSDECIENDERWVGKAGYQGIFHWLWSQGV